MTLQLDLKEQDLLSLEDAIAYEFYMENLSNMLEGARVNDISSFEEGLASLAKSAYTIARVFSLARDQHIEEYNDTNT